MKILKPSISNVRKRLGVLNLIKATTFTLILLLAVAACSKTEIVRETKKETKLSRETAGLEEAKSSQAIELKDYDVFQLDAKPIAKEINGLRIRMYGYNGQIPGPLIKVRQGSTLFVNLTNNMDIETTVHWHGIRLENKFDGVPNVTQNPVKPGESFLYKLDFPDEGIYWYHPHVREDLQQELGLYGNILVEPASRDYFSKADKEVFLFLDDIKMAKNDVDVFSADFARFALMGRFGNAMLVNGETDYELNLKKGDIIRFYITNSANTRTFNFSIENHKLKLIGSDSGKFEREEIVDSVILSVAERYIIEALFDKDGVFEIRHTTPNKTYTLGTISVSDNNKSQNSNFYALKENQDIKSGMDKYRKYFDKAPDYQIDLTIDMSSMQGMDHRIMAMASNEKIEWEDDMAMMNAMSTSKNMKWILKDKKTGKENMDINYQVKIGDIKKIRLFNDPKSMHPMQHPIHLHGQRFLVISEDEKMNKNLAWKDTVLVPKGSTVDLLVEFTNPGKWMIHCHVAEHLEAGMMSMFTVT
ncbi:multicopper oxidase family protein [Candidatus Woesearchaeota archaeon]|nr:multicopper oxidase family protein [Candidatus Woesearchaeota archaeon]